MQSIDLYGLTVTFDKQTPYNAYMKLKTELEQCFKVLKKDIINYQPKTICHYVLLESPVYFTVIADKTDIHIGLYDNHLKTIRQDCSYNDIKGLTSEKINKLYLRLSNMLKLQKQMNPGTEIYQAWQKCLSEELQITKDDDDYER